jgi:Family of unknown function (DUF6132)
MYLPKDKRNNFEEVIYLESMKNWIFKNILVLTGALLGAIGGYCYYHFVGCRSGTCMITSKPVNSTLYFSFMGALFFSILKKNSDADRK